MFQCAILNEKLESLLKTLNEEAQASSQVSYDTAYLFVRSVWVAKQLALPTSDHKIPSSKPAGGGIQLKTVWRFIALSLSLLSFFRLDMT